jgi:transglutaminase-like putative cysteine protease
VFQIADLDGVWLPTAFSPVQVDSLAGEIAFDAETSSLVSRSDTLDGLVYTVESQLPRYDLTRLRAADTAPTGAIAERYLALPDDFPADLAKLARQVTAGAPTRYDQAIALQNWFLAFTYDLSFSSGNSQSAMQEFVAERRGYCEQFAGTFAVFARVVGLPSRVAVGFTPGTLADDGRYHVQGKHAHAWPEIYFEGVGWVPFEPTPGRGNPLAEQYTGVVPAQDDASE